MLTWTRQFDRHLMPLVCVLYVLSYLDRGNIGNAKTAGAQDDLGLSDSQVRNKTDVAIVWEKPNNLCSGSGS